MSKSQCETNGDTGKVSEATAGGEHAICLDRYGSGTAAGSAPEREPELNLRREAAEEKAERLGVAVFFIVAAVGLLEIGVLMGLGERMTALPLWYYAIAVAAVSLFAWFQRERAADIAWIAAALAVLYFAVIFIGKMFF